MSDEGLPAELRRELLRRELLPVAIKNTTASLETARRLLSAGFPSPAFVWAVRSAEIFFREALLFPLVYERDGDVEEAFKWARRFLDGGQWRRSLNLVRDAYGLRADDDEALTEDGQDAWAVWRRDAVGPRGEIVHGRAEADEAMAQAAIAFADRMREWFTLRVMTSDRGPFKGLLTEALQDAREAHERDRRRHEATRRASAEE